MANLIGFDKNRGNLEFKGHCKLSLNFMSNYLYVEPKNEEYKLISSSFKWNYVMKMNLLFVFADFNFLDFCLEFKDEQICKKILDNIASGKKDDTGQTLTSSIDDGFIKPILQKITDNPTLNADLINVMAKWIQLLDDDEKETYTQMMTEYGIYGLISAAIQAETTERSEPNTMKEKRNRKRKFCRIKKEEPEWEMEKKKTDELSTIYSEMVPSTLFRLLYVPRSNYRALLIFTSDQMDSFHEFRANLGSKNDKFKCITCEKKVFIDVVEDGEFCVKMDSKEHSCKPSKKIPEKSSNIKLLRKPDYEVFDNYTGRSKKIMVLFDPDDKNFCYEYSWSEAYSKFYCRGCVNLKILRSNMSKAIIRSEGTEKEYVEIINANHQCDKRKYSPEKYAPVYDYVLKPDFEIQKFCRGDGKKNQRLIIFDASDKTKCYKYNYCYAKKLFRCGGCHNNGKFVTAKLKQNSDAEEYVILSNTKHVCEMLSSDSVKRIILHQPQDFEIMGEPKKPKVFIFEKTDRKRGYEFSMNKNLYLCLGCQSKGSHKGYQKVSVVIGKLLKNEETGNFSFQMKPNQIHCCKPRPYQPEQYEDIPTTYDFFYYRIKHEPKSVKLAIQSLENDQLCYTFVHQKANNYFVCIECRKMKKYYYMKPQKDADGKEYFNHDLKRHICKPIKVATIPKSDILKESGIKFESKSKPKTMIKFDENKIFKSPYFELRPNRLGAPEKKLIILCSNDETLCYEYCYDVEKQIFFCYKCRTKKTRVTAKLHKPGEENGEEPFIVMGKKEHVCEPIKYQPK